LIFPKRTSSLKFFGATFLPRKVAKKAKKAKNLKTKGGKKTPRKERKTKPTHIQLYYTKEKAQP
jgi:hypothetical protein